MAYFNPWMFGHARAPFGGQRHRPTIWKQGEDFLQNTFHFPSFRDLPHENDIEEGYWKCDHSGVYVPACTWFFMAEITNDECSQSSFATRFGSQTGPGREISPSTSILREAYSTSSCSRRVERSLWPMGKSMTFSISQLDSELKN